MDLSHIYIFFKVSISHASSGSISLCNYHIYWYTVMYGRESLTIKKAEHRRIDAFELWCWKRLLRVTWTARRSNQSILKEIIGRTDAEAETPILWPPDVKI